MSRIISLGTCNLKQTRKKLKHNASFLVLLFSLFGSISFLTHANSFSYTLNVTVIINYENHNFFFVSFVAATISFDLLMNLSLHGFRGKKEERMKSCQVVLGLQ